jgi:hypothetical protein
MFLHKLQFSHLQKQVESITIFRHLMTDRQDYQSINNKLDLQVTISKNIKNLVNYQKVKNNLTNTIFTAHLMSKQI